LGEGLSDERKRGRYFTIRIINGNATMLPNGNIPKKSHRSNPNVFTELGNLLWIFLATFLVFFLNEWNKTPYWTSITSALSWLGVITPHMMTGRLLKT
jgi:hypothetical protein